MRRIVMCNGLTTDGYLRDRRHAGLDWVVPDEEQAKGAATDMAASARCCSGAGTPTGRGNDPGNTGRLCWR